MPLWKKEATFALGLLTLLLYFLFYLSTSMILTRVNMFMYDDVPQVVTTIPETPPYTLMKQDLDKEDQQAKLTITKTIKELYANAQPTGSTERPLLSLPNANNTLVAMIHFGRTNKKVERLVCSLRRRGEWDGPVMVMVDTEEFIKNYGELFSQYCGPNVFVVKGQEKDLLPTNSTGHPIPYRNHGTIKRFKTLLWEYIPEPIKDKIEYILYLDEDNVVGKSLQEYLTRTHHRMVAATGLAPYGYMPEEIPTSRVPNPPLNMSITESFIGVFPQIASGAHVFHGGMHVAHKYWSQFCLDFWRERFDTVGRDTQSDQIMMKDIPSITNRKCDFQHINRFSMSFPTSKNVRDHEFNYFIHITNYRQKKIPKNETQAYLLDLLHLNASDPLITTMFGTDEFSLV